MHTPLSLKHYPSNSANCNIVFFGDSEKDIPCIDFVTSVWTYSYSPLLLKKAASGILHERNGLGIL